MNGSSTLIRIALQGPVHNALQALELAVQAGFDRISFMDDARPDGMTSPTLFEYGQQPVPRGAMSRDVIRNVIVDRIPEVRRCYEEQLGHDQDLVGQLVVRFVIGADGTVTDVLASEAFQPNVDACVIAIFRQMRFPEPDGGGVVIVNYPFTFDSVP